MKAYDPSEVSVIVNGNTITGFADGTFVEVSRDTDFSTDVAGADGEVARAVQNDKRGNIVITLLQTSLGNAILSDIYQQQEDKKISSFASLVKNSSGADLHTAKDSWVLKPANAPFSKGIETREWTIRCASVSMLNGGQEAI